MIYSDLFFFLPLFSSEIFIVILISETHQFCPILGKEYPNGWDVPKLFQYKNDLDVIGCEESHPLSLCVIFTGEKDQLVKCQTLFKNEWARRTEDQNKNLFYDSGV